MYRSTPALSSAAVLVSAAVAPLMSASAQQASVSVSPFVTLMPSAGGNPLAGLALTLATDGGFAIRASGYTPLEGSNNTSFWASSSTRPWGADADAVLSIGRGFNRALSPFVFAGVGTASSDSLGYRVRTNNWSYGAGLSASVLGPIGVFAESRWRMSRYVLPTAEFAPSPTQEFRIGLSFHTGGLNRNSRSTPSRRRESRTAATIGFPGTSSSAARVLGTADDYLGTRYVWGGTTPSGFDCSGFTQYVFARHGVSLPRTSRQQAQVGTSITPDWRAVNAGDLVMFADDGRISHVAIYAGRNRIIHSTSSGGGVRYDDLSTDRGAWFLDHMVAVRRVTPDPRGLLLDLARGFAEFGVQLDGPDRAPRPR